jgi:hypothetical protein
MKLSILPVWPMQFLGDAIGLTEWKKTSLNNWWMTT